MDTSKRSLSNKQCSMDRVSRIRRMLEEGEDRTDLFSTHRVSHTPWDLAAERGATTGKKKDQSTRRVLSDVRINVLEAFESGDKVVVRWRLHGKWSQPFAGVKPSGQPVDVTGINIYRFVGDKIVEEDGEVDSATLTQQVFGGLSAEACVQALRAMSRPSEVVVSPTPAGR